MSKEKDVLSALLGAGTVSFHAVFAKALGSVTAALFLSQAYFWQQKARFSKTKTVEEKPFFERTAEAWYEDTGLTTDQQVAARQRLKRLGILEEKKMGLPAKLYYHVCLDTLVSVIYRYNETGKSVVEDYRNKKRYITRTEDGKFRKQKTVKNGNNIESLESLESLRERDAHANSKPSKAEISKRDVAPPESPEQITPWNEDLLAAEFLKHIAGETPETAAKHAKEICQKIEIGPLANATDEQVNELVDRSRREAREFQAAFENSPRQTRTFEDAEKEIAKWAATDGIETVKYRHELARRKFNEKDLPQLAAHFCSIYGKPGGSDREQLLKDPIEFFRVGLNKYLTNQNQFDRTATGQQGNGQQPQTPATYTRPNLLPT